MIYGTSDNAQAAVSNAHASHIGFRPRDSADGFAAARVLAPGVEDALLLEDAIGLRIPAFAGCKEAAQRRRERLAHGLGASAAGGGHGPMSCPAARGDRARVQDQG